MSNAISMRQNEGDESIHPLLMSNGLTSVFVEVLAISGSILAKSIREKELVIWLSQHDQAIVGLGTVVFSIDEMSWALDEFENE